MSDKTHRAQHLAIFYGSASQAGRERDQQFSPDSNVMPSENKRLKILPNVE